MIESLKKTAQAAVAALQTAGAFGRLRIGRSGSAEPGSA